MITIVDYGLGNMGSMLNMFQRIGVDAHIASEPDELDKAEKLVLPGVGAFDAAMRRIKDKPGLLEVLVQKGFNECIPVLGVCLGMQLLTTGSEEGTLPGLNWIPGETKRFPALNGLKVPHMGWNTAQPNTSSKLTRGVGQDCRYYFVHSYYVRTKTTSHSSMRTHYGIEFASAIERDNIFGVQFHPEKSHRFGMAILKNFSEL